MSRGPDAGTLLARALETDARRAGCPVCVTDSNWSGWASATFNGARHELSFDAAESPAFDHWLTGLPESSLSIRGLLVADVAIKTIRRAAGVATIKLEALTVEE